MFLVLHQTKMPSVLIETGFISNSTEEKYLVSKKGQDYMASAIFRAFRDYKNDIDKRSTISHSDQTNKTNHETQPLKEVNTSPTTATKMPPPVVKAKETTTIVKEKTVTVKKEKTTEATIQQRAANMIETEVMYKLQILSALGEVTNTQRYESLPNFSYFTVGKYYKYTCGQSNNIKDIITLKHQLKEKYPDAFVIALYKGEKISLLEAKKLLKPNL